MRFASTALFLALFPTIMIAETPKPPSTKVEAVTDDLHGVKVTDPYRWLEDQKSPATREWLHSQMEYTKSVLDSAPGRDVVTKRIASLMRTDAQAPSAHKGGRYFYSKRKADQNKAVICVRKGRDGVEEVLVDPNPMSKDGSVSAYFMGVSEDGTLMAYGIQTGGEDEYVLKLMDVDSKRDLGDAFPKTRYFSVSILRDKSGLYYARYDDRGPRLMFHKMGAPVSGDTEVYGQGLPQGVSISGDLSDDSRWLVVTVSPTFDRSNVYLKDLSKPESSFQTIVEGVDALFNASMGGTHLFVHTTWNAPRGRVLVTELEHPGAKEQWKEIVPERKFALEWAAPAGGKVVLAYLENACSRVQIVQPDGKPVHDLALPALGTLSGFVGEWTSSEAFYGFSSFNQPHSWYRYDLNAAKQEIWFRPSVPVDPAKFEVRQVWYASKDGTRVPMFLFHKRGLKPDASTPALLYGYGGFNVNITPAFSVLALVWAELGGVYAVANLRGGGEFGEDWHKAGMLEKKQNVFDDYTAAAEWLIVNKMTSSSKLAILGGSNGGLLTGAALTQHPGLYGAVICAVPLLDMVRYHEFKVAKFWVPEYGSSEDAKQFEYIYKYSPYHHVDKGAKYPAIMFVTGDSDTRFDPLHARKMTALVQASTASGKPVLLYYDTKSGHAGGKPVDQLIEDTAAEILFLTSQLGIPVRI